MSSVPDREGIAIIGIGCRFPGNANSPMAFWEMLRNGVDAITDIPADRPQLTQVYDPDPSKPGKSYLRRGGFVGRVDEWDAAFFGISPREAAHMDPQHRLLLEVAWEALEDGGQNVDALAGSRTGVFIGISTHEYGDIIAGPANRHLINSHSNSGSSSCIAANRMSYLFDLRGPSFTVDTACSSSLTATHLACRSIAAGDCDLAIVGGVQIQLNPEIIIGFCKATMISPTGECRAFDASANGYVRGEGAGVVVLKPLAKALADGDPIYAVIVGSAINEDGRTVGLTVPSASAQEAMVREALASAGLTGADVHYMEAHGTGTPVGDPIEAAALGAVLGEGRAPGDYCAMGSVKSNIGHLEAAAGVAGLIKAALCVSHREIPPSLHFHTPNPTIDFEGGRLRVVTAREPWIAGSAPAVAGVNSFGFGGANAHVLLREAPSGARQPTGREQGATILPISARSPEALAELARRYVLLLRNPGAPALADIASTAARDRAHHAYRIAIVADTHADTIEALDAASRAPSGGKLAFAFGGMGPQWWGMGQQLRRDNPVFRETLERCHEALRPHARWSLLDEMARDEKTSRLSEPDIAQVTNFALQVGLVAVWKSWGITPDAVVGHSAGEIAAAHVSGALTLEQAIETIYHRSRVQSKAPPGRILAVGMAAGDLEPLLRDYHGDLEIAAINSPVSCAVAGSTEAAEALLARLERDGVFARMLTFAVPYHSAKMDPIRDELLGVLSNLRPSASTIPIVSTVSGTWIDGTTLDAQHWWLNTRRMVRFADAMGTLFDSGHTTVLEVSPHPVLGGSITECLAARGETATILGSLRRKEDERTIMLRSLAQLYTGGRAVEWGGVFVGPRSNVRLPAYPWQRERHWFASASVDGDAAYAPRDNGAAQHPLLGRRVRAAHPLWESSLGDDRLSFLDDHVVQGTTLFPAAAYVEMALGAADALRPAGSDSPLSVRSVSFKRALAIDSRSTTLVQIDVDAESRRFEIHASSPGAPADAAWSLHADGALGDVVNHAPRTVDLTGIRARCTTEVSAESCYGALARGGLEYGPAFRGITKVWTGAGEALGELRLPNADAAGYQVHPALLDGVFQLLVGASGSSPERHVFDDASDGSVLLPATLRELTIGAPVGDACWAHARLVTLDGDGMEGDIDIIDEHGLVLATISGFRCKRIAGSRPRESLDQWLFEYQWERRSLGGAEAQSVVDTSPSDVASRVQPAADALSAEWHWDEYYTRLLPRLPAVTVAYMLRAVEQLAGALAAGMSVTLDSLGVVEPRRRLAEHVMKVLADEGVLRHAGAAWDIVSLPAKGETPETLSQAIATDFPAYSTDLALFIRCATHLADVLTGRMDPETALFAGEGADLVARFYRETPGARYYNTIAADVLGAAATRTTDDARPLRVLEIGGGMGGTTAFALPKLDAARVEYVFTDITPLFTEQAKHTFGDRAYFSARPLDIERDPTAQGFAPHSFDIILAANVFHATPSLTATLANVKKLLAPGGMLVLLELTRPAPWLDLIFGLTPGWWRFADHDLRPTHPLLGGDAWCALLERSGFEDVAAVADAKRDGEAAQTVFLARASAASNAEPTAVVEGEWLIFADRRGIGGALADRLATLGVRATLVEQGAVFRQRDDGSFELPIDDAAAAGELIALLEADRRRPRGIVFLWTLDADAANAVAPDELLETQRVGLGSALALVQALAGLPGGDLPELWFVTAGAQPMGRDAELLATTQAPMWGFARVITKEQRGLRTRLADLSAECAAAEIDALAREIATPEWEDELALRAGTRYARRLHRVAIADVAVSSSGDPAEQSENFRGEITTPGSLETLTLRRAERAAPGRGEVEIAVAATGLNFRDVMIAMGVYPAIANEASFSRGLLGIDCAGTVTRCGEDVTDFAVGDDVVGIAAGAFGKYVITPAALLARRPRSLTHAQGAAIPAAFITALYSLRDLARLEPGERVLIHAATGGVGLAAIQVAREAGAEIFATAGSAEKRELLASLGIEHVMDSRSLRFADEVMERTNGEGVDVVLNSLAGEAIARGIGTLREGGRFVEIGKRDIYQDSRIGLLAFRRNLSLFAVDIDRLGLTRPDRLRTVLADVIERFDNGTFTPLPLHEFPISRVEDAMRFMAQAKHIGKVVVSMDDPAIVVAPRVDRPVVRSDGTYLITGGLGGFGLLVAEWLAREGAGCIVLVGRSGAIGDEVRELRERRPNVRVEVLRADVSRADDVQRVFAEVRATMPPLRGVIHAAMVLDDVPLTELTRERLDRVLAPKMAGAWNLHQQTLNDQLDWFAMFSSLAAIIGNPYQANYCAANAFLDALAHERRALGLPGLSISWGMLSQSGYLARHEDVADYLERQGYLPFSPAQAFEVLPALLRHDVSHLMAARVEWPRWLESSPAAGVSQILRQFAESPAERGAAGTAARGEAGSLRATLLAASAEERSERVIAFLRETVCKVLGLSSSKLQNDRALTDLGFDSLMAVELITAMSTRMGIEVAAVKLLQGMSVSALAELVLEQLAAERVAPAAAITVAPAAPVQEERAPVNVESSPSSNGKAVHNGAAPSPTNGVHAAAPSPYSSLDYSRPTNGLRALRRIVTVALHTVAKVDIEGLEHLPATGGCLLATNHLSAADLPVLFSVVPRRTVMYAAERLRSSTVLNWLFSEVGDTIYVRRGEHDTEALESGLAVLRAGGLLALSPEGTRSQTGALARGRTGVAYLAMLAGVPVVPIALWGQERMPTRWRSMRRAPVTVRIGAPLRFEQREPDAARLREGADEIMRTIAELLPEEYRGVYG